MPLSRSRAFPFLPRYAQRRADTRRGSAGPTNGTRSAAAAELGREIFTPRSFKNFSSRARDDHRPGRALNANRDHGSHEWWPAPWATARATARSWSKTAAGVEPRDVQTNQASKREIGSTSVPRKCGFVRSAQRSFAQPRAAFTRQQRDAKRRAARAAEAAGQRTAARRLLRRVGQRFERRVAYRVSMLTLIV